MLTRLASSHHGAEISGNDSAPGWDTIQQVPEQCCGADHRRIKQRIGPMLGFKRFGTAAVTISGIELVERIRKQQFKTGNLPGRPATAPDIWSAILAA